MTQRTPTLPTAPIATFAILLTLVTGACSEFPTQPTVTVDVGFDSPDPGEVSSGCATDESCNDGLWCTGTEVCDPTHADADERGCVSLEAPKVDDGIACTIDACDEGTRSVLHDPSACDCQRAGQACTCVGDECQPAGACASYVCSPGLTCVRQLAEAGSTCDPPDGCREGAICTGDGACVGGELDHGACDDELFCNGPERCAPDDADAAEDGCVAGQPPDLSDGIDCTEDTCDEEADLAIHTPTDACGECRDDRECTIPNLPPCQRASCTDGLCVPEPLAPGTTCNDDIPCTTDDRCDEDANCVGAANHDACRDTLWCNGQEECAPNREGADDFGCVDGVPPTEDDGNVCTTEVCLECERPCDQGREGRIDHVPTGDCLCSENADCPQTTCLGMICLRGDCLPAPTERGEPCGSGCATGACDGEGNCEAAPDDDFCEVACQSRACQPEEPDADDDGCVLLGIEDDRTPCQAQCNLTPVDGECWHGDCQFAPEAPLGSEACGDGVDNDCDGRVDGDDTTCEAPTVLALSAVEDHDVGFDAPGATMYLVPRTPQAELPHQGPNLYCVGHHLEYEQLFEGDAQADPLVLAIDGDFEAELEERTSVDGNIGMRMCDAAGVEIGPFPLPDPVSPVPLTFMVEVVVHDYAADPFGSGTHLLVAYKTDATVDDGTNKYIPVFGHGGSRAEVRPGVKFIVPNHRGSNEVTLRLQPVGSNPDVGCAFLDAVRIYSLPRPGQRAEFPAYRHHLQWRYGGTTEPALQSFEVIDPQDFFTPGPGEHGLTRLGESASAGNFGVRWHYRREELALLTLPPITAMPVGFERDHLLIWEGAAQLRGGNPDDRHQLHFVVNINPTGAFQLSSQLAALPDWAATNFEMAQPIRARHRAIHVLPEEAKHGDFRVAVAGRIDLLGGADMDEFEIYSFDRPALDDLRIVRNGTVEYNRPTHTVTVRSARTGPVRVQCYWQATGDTSVPTVASNPFTLTFE